MAIKIGGTEVIDNTRALKNISSVDATTVTALSDAGVGGGGEADFVASGAIANGDVVVLNSDGTVSIVNGASQSIGSATVYESADTQYNSVVFDSNSNKIVIAYKDGGNSNYGTAIVGTVSGTSITFGTPVVFVSQTVSFISAVFDSSSNKVIIAYRDGGNSNYGTAIVGTVSGTTISFGTSAVFDTTNCWQISSTFDSNSNKVVIAYTDASSSNEGNAVVGTVSGTSISFGTPVVFETSCWKNTATFDSNSNKVVISYADLGNSSHGTAVVGTVSGTSISFGTPVVFNPASSDYISSTFDSNANKIVIAYKDGGSSNYGVVIVGNVSGTTITFGTETTIAQYFNDNSTTFDSNANKVVISYRGPSNRPHAVLGTVSNTSITLDTAVELNTDASNGQSATFDSNSNKVVTVYVDSGTSNYGTAVAFQLPFTNASSYIGVASEAISDTATGAITIDGGVNESTTLGNYSLANASYDSKSFNVASEENNPRGLAFNTDGTKMYVSGITNDSVHQYSLSTAFDVSTASYDNVSFSLASQDASSRGLAFNNAGTKMYVVGPTADSVYQYSLSTAFDLSTTSYDSVSFSVASQESSPQGMTFNNDGTKMYVCGRVTADVFQYSLSSAFDLSTASYDSVSFSIGGVVGEQDVYPHDLVFNSDGTKMYVVGDQNNSVYQYSLSTAYDLSTASYDSVSFSISSQDGGPNAITFNSDGSKLYMLGGDNDTVYQYTTTAPLTIGTTYYVADDGSLSTTNNGRKIGRAISATKLLVNSNMSGDEMNTYLGGLV